MPIKLSRLGQMSVEYFVLLAAIAGVTLLGASTFLGQTQQTAQNVVTQARNSLANSGNGSGGGGTTVPPGNECDYAAAYEACKHLGPNSPEFAYCMMNFCGM